ncbi:MAG: hypothetical protein ABWZ25_19415 [Chitinophagaceae bacterium]
MNILPIRSGTERKISVLILLLTPLIIYFYFLQWKPGAISGDDLYIFRAYQGFRTMGEQINLPTAFQKFRPIHGLSIHLIIEWFQKNLSFYYMFNVLVLASNTLLLAAIINLFLRSFFFSWVVSLLFATSRFEYYSITQLMNGGALEGLAVTFFLLMMFHMIRAVINSSSGTGYRVRNIAFALLYANLALYTHERYFLLPLLIGLSVLIYPGLRGLLVKNKVWIVTAAAGSALLYTYLKVYVYNLPFFLGTSGTQVGLSFGAVFKFLMEGFLSVFQINTGERYLVGISFGELPTPYMIIGIIFVLGILVLLILYLRRVGIAVAMRDKQQISSFYLFGLLIVLFGSCILPAAITVRMEQRWLVAPYILAILLVVFMVCNLGLSARIQKMVLCSYIVLSFLLDYSYLHRGAHWIFTSQAEELASDFKDAIDKGIIRPSTEVIFILVKERNAAAEAGIKWSICDGYLFEFYQNSSKHIQFEDSISRDDSPLPIGNAADFDPQKDQLLYLSDKVTDVTPAKTGIKDSSGFAIRRAYDPQDLRIPVRKMDRFVVKGFHQNEGEIRWSDGNSSIQFIGGYMMDDTVRFDLQIYPADACKDIIPVITIVDMKGGVHQAILKSRSVDTFNYLAFFGANTNTDFVSIKAGKIKTTGDKRILSFPFKELRITQKNKKIESLPH